MHESLDEFEFRQIWNELRPLIDRPLIDVRIKLLLNILKTNRPIKTKFCIHIIIDKIYVVIRKSLFFANLQQSYGPSLTAEFGFCSIS